MLIIYSVIKLIQKQIPLPKIELQSCWSMFIMERTCTSNWKVQQWYSLCTAMPNLNVMCF